MFIDHLAWGSFSHWPSPSLMSFTVSIPYLKSLCITHTRCGRGTMQRLFLSPPEKGILLVILWSCRASMFQREAGLLSHRCKASPELKVQLLQEDSSRVPQLTPPNSYQFVCPLPSHENPLEANTRESLLQ